MMNQHSRDLLVAKNDVKTLERARDLKIADIELKRAELYLLKRAPDRNKMQGEIQGAVLDLRRIQEKIELARRAVKALERAND
jgi:hypothetical protein